MVAAKQLSDENIALVPPIGLPAKMVKIMAAVGTIAKGGTNAQQNYKFIQGDAVLDAFRAEFIKHNIALFSRALEYEQASGTTQKGGTNWHAIVKFEFTLVDADTGETRSDTWFGESIDSSDKSFNKAATAALKYWLMKTFMISAGDDIDQESPQFERQRRNPQQQLRGNGQQQRRIPPQSNEKASNFDEDADPAITGQNAEKPAQISFAATYAQLRKSSNGKRYYALGNAKSELEAITFDTEKIGREFADSLIEMEMHPVTEQYVTAHLQTKNGKSWYEIDSVEIPF